jgi:hypothetical protein
LNRTHSSRIQYAADYLLTISENADMALANCCIC